MDDKLVKSLVKNAKVSVENGVYLIETAKPRIGRAEFDAKNESEALSKFEAWLNEPTSESVVMSWERSAKE